MLKRYYSKNAFHLKREIQPLFIFMRVLTFFSKGKYKNQLTDITSAEIRTILLLSITSFMIASPLDAQVIVDGDEPEQIYPKVYFDQFAPQTARDMIDRLPSFTMDTGADIRGFGGGAGNVLINGARPSSKVGGIEDALARISAQSVDHIEVIRGAAGSSETAGQSVIANIVTNSQERSSVWNLELERAGHGKVNSAAEVSLSKRIVDWDTSTKLSGFIERQPLEGTRVTRDTSEIATFTELENVASDNRQLALSAEAMRSAGGGRLTLNGRISYSPGSFESLRSGFNGVGIIGIPNQLRRINFSREQHDTELGVSWKRSFSDDWLVKLLSLSSFQDHRSESRVFVERPIGMRSLNSRFDVEQQLFESVVRGTLGQSGGRTLQPEIGGEIAYNRLENKLASRVQDQNDVIEMTLPTSSVLVEEIRGEAFVNLIWKVSEKVIVETGLGAELSEISVSIDADSKQSFFFAKPFATLIYDPKPGMQLRFGARRTVGQLDFSDFAASVSVSDDRLLGGNPELEPDQATRLSSSIDIRSESRGTINLEFFHEWRDDILEQVVLPSGSKGLGNAGSARVWGLKSTASLPLSPIVPEGLIEIEAEFLDSRFFDPIISDKRSVSSIDSTNLLFEFRQDISAWKVAWGGSYRAPLEGPFFFADEVSINRDGPQWNAFIETTRIEGIKINLTFTGITSQNFFRERRFFSPDRGGQFDGSQVIDRDRRLSATLSISGQF